jgi:hypothetical protein
MCYPQFTTGENMYLKIGRMCTVVLAAAAIFCAHSLPARAKASPDPAKSAENKVAQDAAKKAGTAKKGAPAKPQDTK